MRDDKYVMFSDTIVLTPKGGEFRFVPATEEK